MDEALALPTERAARIALRTQQVIAFETNVAHVADPLGGSYFVEALTDEMERQAEEIFSHLDSLGGGSMLDGVIAGIEDNWFQGCIADSAYEQERLFNRGERIVVGVNRFLEGNDEDSMPILQITSEDETRQLKRLHSVRQHRNQAAVDAALARLAADAADPEVNLMPTLIEASGVYASLGEMMNTMAGVFGRHVEVPTI
jgi:methylmalonyl-CoA mutase N-terminal domain/subunit